ncbi:MAG: hypothetical protein IKP65_02000 [Alphaproteobacteria bacterium]|nr:hypothetical protein [Alphaproteobacteria bacterium]
MKKVIEKWLASEEGQNWLKERKQEWDCSSHPGRKTFEGWIRYQLMGIFCTTYGTVNKIEIKIQ